MYRTQSEERSWGPRQWLKVRLYGIAFLGFLAFPVTNLLSGRNSTGVVVAGLVGLAAFAACYIRVVWQATPEPHRNSTPYALGGALLVGGALCFVPGIDMLTGLVFYGMTLLMVSQSRRWWVPTVVTATIAYPLLGLALGATFSDLVGTDVVIFSTGWLLVASYQQIQDTRQLREARAELARLAVTEERLRIARDLHDVMGQRLAAVALKSDLAIRLLRTDPDRAETEMTEVGKVAREALDEVRATVAGYRDASLAAEVHTAVALLTAAGVEVTTSGVPVSMPPAAEEVASWVVREAATNVVRHARATRCRIVLGRNLVEVADDGVGGSVSYGNGLSGLAERVSGLGGQLTVGPAGGWFTVRATIPS